MPFAVFRRNQRKMMAVIAVLAMFGFVLSDSGSLLRWNNNAAGTDPVVAKLYGKEVRRSDLAVLQAQRLRANLFMSLLSGGMYPSFFGETTERALVDGYILQHKAEQLGMPADSEVAKLWLRNTAGLTTDRFEAVFRQGFTEGMYKVSDEQLLADIGNQLRLRQVATLPGLAEAEVTPLDVYLAHRDQQERVSARAVAFPVEEYVGKVGEPSEAEVQAVFDKFKNALPKAGRDTPGFMVPRKVQVEYVMLDAPALARQAEAKLTDAEVRTYYEGHKAQFPRPETELPAGLFAGDTKAELTPRQGDPFAEVREQVRDALAEERAREQVEAKFAAIREDIMRPFSERYAEILDANKEAKDRGGATNPLPVPEPEAIAAKAKELGLDHEVTPPLTREDAERHVPIAGASRGEALGGEGQDFTDVVFAANLPVYDDFELTDGRGRRYLGWKLADLPPRVPALKEVRAEVVRAWKLDKARALAEADAKALAEAARKADGDLAKAAEPRPTITTDPVAKLQFNPILSQAQFGAPTPSDIPQLPDAGEALRSAYFDLKPKDVVVAPNGPKTVYYVLALNDRKAVALDDLYGTFGVRSSLQPQVARDLAGRRAEDWMSALRAEAGLPADWTPPDETKGARRRADA